MPAQALNSVPLHRQMSYTAEAEAYAAICLSLLPLLRDKARPIYCQQPESTQDLFVLIPHNASTMQMSPLTIPTGKPLIPYLAGGCPMHCVAST